MRPGRCLGLHLRARGVPLATALAAVVVLACWRWGEALADSPRYGTPGRLYVVLAGPLLVAVLLAPTLAGADEDLERATAMPWPLVRLCHAVAAAATPALALAGIGLREPATYGAPALARNAVGFAGVVAIAAVLLGAQLAWVPVCGWTALAFALHVKSPESLSHRTWPVHPGPGGVAVGAALVLLLVGIVAYALLGVRRPGRSGR